MSAQDIQRLNHFLDSAVNAWINPSSLSNLLGCWRGSHCLLEFSKNQLTGYPNCIVLVEYARCACSKSGIRLMDYAQKLGAFGQKGVTSPTWQTLLALVCHLLGNRQAKPIHRNVPKSLMIAGDHVGHVLSFEIDRIELPVAVGLTRYLNPLSLGVTVLDRSLCESICLAARCARQATGCKSGHSLRIACDLSNTLTAELSGSSAGGLVAASMVATMNQQQIDLQKSTTCKLRLRQQNASLIKKSDSIQMDDLTLVPIGGTVDKLKET